MSRRRLNMAAVLTISIVSGVSATLGIATAIVGGHLLLASTVLGSSSGPAPMVVRGIAELLGGTLFAVAGIAFSWRRSWALSVIRFGWLPWVTYEIGLLLGRSAERLTFALGEDLLVFGF